MDEVFNAAAKKAGWGPSKGERMASDKKNKMARKIRVGNDMKPGRMKTGLIGNDMRNK